MSECKCVRERRPESRKKVNLRVLTCQNEPIFFFFLECCPKLDFLNSVFFECFLKVTKYHIILRRLCVCVEIVFVLACVSGISPYVTPLDTGNIVKLLMNWLQGLLCAATFQEIHCSSTGCHLSECFCFRVSIVAVRVGSRGG